MSGQVTKCAKYWLSGQMYKGTIPVTMETPANNFTDLILGSKNALCVYGEAFSYGLRI